MIYLLHLILIQCVLLTNCTRNDNDNDNGNGNGNGNDGRVFVTQSHSDIGRPSPVTGQKAKGDARDGATEGVVFIPNGDAMHKYDVTTGDVIDVGRATVAEAETPKSDTFFVAGKNGENNEKPAEFAKSHKRQDAMIVRAVKSDSKALNCSATDCDNTVNSICGGKEENRHTKYRLFLNDCYFRKVNCAFHNVINRYNRVPMHHCKAVGVHRSSRPHAFKPVPLPAQKVAGKQKTRRSFSSRRSLNMAMDGGFCGHACPASCADHYDPQCALSSGGQRKVFLNHCRLDHNSCLYKVVWHRRPLAECVGGRKADLTQNRAFVGWMQRAGIVDGRGRLVHS